MKEEPKRKKPQKPKRTSDTLSDDRLENIKNASVRLYEEIIFFWKAYELSVQEGFVALSDAVWWLCRNVDNLPPKDENAPKTLDSFIEALRIYDHDRRKKETKKVDREG